MLMMPAFASYMVRTAADAHDADLCLSYGDNRPADARDAGHRIANGADRSLLMLMMLAFPLHIPLIQWEQALADAHDAGLRIAYGEERRLLMLMMLAFAWHMPGTR